MIEVRKYARGWKWSGPAPRNLSALIPEGDTIGLAGYPTSAHALRDAWTWCGPSTPALIFIGGRP